MSVQLNLSDLPNRELVPAPGHAANTSRPDSSRPDGVVGPATGTDSVVINVDDERDGGSSRIPSSSVTLSSRRASLQYQAQALGTVLRSAVSGAAGGGGGGARAGSHRNLSALNLSLGGNGALSDFSCQMCLDHLPASRGFLLSRCSHVFCAACLSEYVGIEVREGRVFVCCPYDVSAAEEEGGGHASHLPPPKLKPARDAATSHTPAPAGAARSGRPPPPPGVTLAKGTCGELLDDSETVALLTVWARRHAREEWRAATRGQAPPHLLPPAPPSLAAVAGSASAQSASPPIAPMIPSGPSSSAAIATPATAAPAPPSANAVAAAAAAGGFDRAAMEASAVAAALARFATFKLNAENRDMRQCPGCAHSQEGRADAPAMACEACGLRYCFAHSAAHPGRTCADWAVANADSEAASESFIAHGMHAKACPTCGVFITKSEGCNQVKCTKCGHSFCWLCGAKVDSSEFPLHFQVRDGGIPALTHPRRFFSCPRSMLILLLSVST